jgi:GNAT superfamily N-acetyltransferase
MDLHRRLGGMQVFTYAERPDLSERTGEAESTFPEFIHHGEVTTRYWPRLREELPELQLLLYDEERDTVVGRGQTVPASARAGLPGGVDDVLEWRFGGGASEEPDVLCALVAVVDRRRQGEGLSALLIEGMRTAAGAAGLSSLIAPVRPTRKQDFPLIPLERYARWTRADGLPRDPWIRLHARLGAELVEVCTASMRITGMVADWEEWTGLEFPDDGDYVVPGALVPVRFEGGTGEYFEPNVWMRHTA